MKYLVLIISFALFGLLVIGNGPCFAESYDSVRADYRKLTSSVSLQKKRVNWEKLIRRFDRFILEHPGDPSLDRAMYLLGRTWDGLSLASGSREDAQQTVEAYGDMIARFPRSSLADDALFHAGRTAESRLKDSVLASGFYRQIVDSYSNGDMVKRAQSRLDELPPQRPGSGATIAANEQPPDNTIGSAPSLQKIRYWSGPEYTRIVFDLTAPVVAKPAVLKGSNPRIFFDLMYTKLGPAVPSELHIVNGLVKQVRTSQHDVQKARVVIDLNRQSEYRLNFLQKPYRLVIDVLGEPSRVGISSPSPTSASASSQNDDISNILNERADKVPVLHVPQEQHDEGIHLIVVDAGHGGKDPGAIGPGRIMEKDVTLKLAKELAAELRSRLGVRVLLTRSDDRFLELRERTAYANKVGADLFISLHANASRNAKAYGTETYFLNLSKNDKAAEVAARENGTSLQDVGNLEAILFDLMANAKINESSRLAAEVQQALIGGLKPHYKNIRDLGVKQGPFHVLLGATMPSVLVEAAFISNPRESKRLVSTQFQKRVASAIVNGVNHYSASLDQVAKR